jgi:hypothetical protein
MKVRTELKAGQDTATAIGAVAVNLADVDQYLSVSATITALGGTNTVAAANSSAVSQTASASNTGAVSAIS